MKRILLAVEDSLFADEQVNFLAKHTLAPDTQITVLTVSVPFIAPDCGYAVPNPYWETILVEEDTRRKELVSDVLKKLKKVLPNMAIEGQVAHGSASNEILSFAKEGHYDWIIMASHGRKGFDKLFLGSVAQSVISHAHCSVSIIRCAGKGAEKVSENEKAKTEEKLESAARA